MSSNIKAKNFRLELAADKDVRQAIELLQNYFDEKVESENFSLKDLAAESEMDKSALSRILNGKKSNLTLLTVAKVFRAMGGRFVPTVETIGSHARNTQNYRCFPEFSAQWTVLPHKSAAQFRSDEVSAQHSVHRMPDTKPSHRFDPSLVGAGEDARGS